MSSTAISLSSFMVGPGARAGAEIVDRGDAVLVGLDVDERGGAGGERLAVGLRELLRVAHGEGFCAECAGKARPVVVGDGGQLRRQRAVLARTQPDITER